MKYLNLILTVIAIAILGVIWRIYSLEEALKNSHESSQLIISSNQGLINSNARLESEITGLKKEVAAIKESFNKK
jgi:hypothetical protein